VSEACQREAGPKERIQVKRNAVSTFELFEERNHSFLRHRVKWADAVLGINNG